MTSYKELIVWQKSYQLAVLIYKITRTFPKEETYGLVSQITRSAISIPSNIAEGYSRHRKLEYLQFLHIAYGSAAELETQLILSKDLGYLSAGNFTSAQNLLSEVMKMLNAIILKIKSTN